MDTIARKYLKNWLKIPTNGVTDASIFHPFMLNIKAPSQLYKEAHATSYAMLRLKGDQVVNQALDSRLEREATWTRKSATVCNADKMFQENIT